MNSEDKLYAIFWVCVTIIIISIGVVTTTYSIKQVEAYTSNGYSKQGSVTSYWYKEKE